MASLPLPVPPSGPPPSEHAASDELRKAELTAETERYKADSAREIEKLKAQLALEVARVQAKTQEAIAAETRVVTVQTEAQKAIADLQAKATSRAEGIKGRYAVLIALATGALGVVTGRTSSSGSPGAATAFATAQPAPANTMALSLGASASACAYQSGPSPSELDACRKSLRLLRSMGELSAEALPSAENLRISIRNDLAACRALIDSPSGGAGSP